MGTNRTLIERIESNYSNILFAISGFGMIWAILNSNSNWDLGISLTLGTGFLALGSLMEEVLYQNRTQSIQNRKIESYGSHSIKALEDQNLSIHRIMGKDEQLMIEKRIEEIYGYKNNECSKIPSTPKVQSQDNLPRLSWDEEDN